MSAVGGSIFKNINDSNYSISRQHSLSVIDLNPNNHIKPLIERKMGANGDPSTVNSSKGKHASMEIYKPPSLRSGDGKGKLNVHAKEFVMNNGAVKSNLDTSKSERIYPLNSSKSSGNVTLNLSKSNSSQLKSNGSEKAVPNLSSSNNSNHYDLQRAKSSGYVLLENSNLSSRVQFKVPSPEKMAPKSNLVKERKTVPSTGQLSGNLKRSKSLSAADASLKSMELGASFTGCSVSFTEYHVFPAKLRSLIKQAVENPNQTTDKDKIILGRSVVEHVLTDKDVAYPAAKLSVAVIDRDKSGAYLDSVMNTCQMLYQTKKTSALSDTVKFMAFLVFLQEMYTELKRSKMQLKKMPDSITPPRITFLVLISRCCENILVQNDTHSPFEIGCLYHALTSVGRDIELELPNMFARLFDIVREVLLRSRSGPQVQKTLLKLLELRAANWQLPISALNYYYPPKTSNM